MSNNIPDLIYHYTSFDKLQSILKCSTLRFKESTQSNDILDTTRLINILQRLTYVSDNANTDIAKARDFLINYFKQPTYNNQHTSMVSCFSTLPDSRLLWDAYTMNRPSNITCKFGENKYCHESPAKYTGVCIAFKSDEIEKLIKSVENISCEKAYFSPILYGDDKIITELNNWLEVTCNKIIKLSKDDDQSQDIIPPINYLMFTRVLQVNLKKCVVFPTLEFIGTIEALSPLFKHAFWYEEREIRASLCFATKNIGLYKNINDQSGAKYFDLPITSDCVDHIILGPEFNDESYEYINNQKDYKLSFSDFSTKLSIGTGVIRSN